MKIIDAAAAHAALPIPALIDTLERAFAAGCEAPLRHAHHIVAADGSEGTSLIMPAWRSDGYFGIKVVNVFPGNSQRGLPGLHSSYLLFDVQTGRPLAQIDGDVITVRRTVAASALAARFVASTNATTLLIVGTGKVASMIAQAHAAVRPIRKVLVWARNAASAQQLAAQLRSQQALDASAVTNLQDAAAVADIVSCATLATEPIVHGAWLRPGAHLDLIGSFAPQMREADDDCFVDADLYVDTDEAAAKSGDLLGPISRGVIRREDIRATLAQLCRGEVKPRHEAGRRTVFKSVGAALEDLAAATMVFEALVPGSR